MRAQRRYYEAQRRQLQAGNKMTLDFLVCVRLTMEARACKKAMAAGNALQQQALLQLILSFVGSKEYLFMSLVDSNWKDAYERVIALAKPCGRLQHEGNKCTSYAAAFASVPQG